MASFKAALVVVGLPKTRCGKILRGTMRKIADGEDYPMPATIDDPAVLGQIEAALASAGLMGPREFPASDESSKMAAGRDNRIA